MIFYNSFIAVFILMFMIGGIKGKRVINQVLETRREVCFALGRPSRVVRRPARQLLLTISHFFYKLSRFSLKIRLSSIFKFIFNKFLLPFISPSISAKGVPTNNRISQIFRTVPFLPGTPFIFVMGLTESLVGRLVREEYREYS